ncbi:MAG: hypothetical protein NE330_11920 [Lentisphaeraceae bacterium]|nr:hypothetical protein [Lentisphaeraceae bacterium]
MSIFNNLFLSRWDTAGDIQSLEAYKADYSDVKELRRKFKLGAAHDKKQDKEIADIKDMILELYSFQLAMVEYLEKDHAFDREAFQEILDNLDQVTDNE